MKKAKKLVSLLLAVVMLLSLAVSGGAATEEAEPTVTGEICAVEESVSGTVTVDSTVDGITGVKGSITISNATAEEDYTLYQLMYLDSYQVVSAVDIRYSYKVVPAWKNFFQTDIAKQYVTLDGDDHVTWTNAAKGDGTPTIQEFSQEALKWAKNQSGLNLKTLTAGSTAVEGTSYDGYTVKFKDLPLGYYLVDSSVGAACSLNTVVKDVVIRDKNMVPTVDKKVYSSGGWSDSNNETVTRDVYFKSEIILRRNSNNIIFHDTMDDGLEFNAPAGNAPLEFNINDFYKELTLFYGQNNPKPGVYPESLTINVDYTVDTNPTDNHTFDIKFTDEFYKKINAKNITAQADKPSYVAEMWKVYIYYSAKLTDAAIDVDAGVKNKAKVTYGEKNSSTNEPETTTKTFEIPVFKFTGTGTEVGVKDAEFKLFRSTGTVGENVIWYTLVKTSTEGATEDVYKITGTVTTEQEATGVRTPESGKFRIQGLAAGTYNLKETATPAGFNGLATAVEVTIDADGTIRSADPNGYVKIRNSSGAVMPETGGIGTTIFYVVGSILLVGATILLIVKKRMNDEK